MGPKVRPVKRLLAKSLSQNLGKSRFDRRFCEVQVSFGISSKPHEGVCASPVGLLEVPGYDNAVFAGSWI